MTKDIWSTRYRFPRCWPVFWDSVFSYGELCFPGGNLSWQPPQTRHSRMETLKACAVWGSWPPPKGSWQPQTNDASSGAELLALRQERGLEKGAEAACLGEKGLAKWKTFSWGRSEALCFYRSTWRSSTSRGFRAFPLRCSALC